MHVVLTAGGVYSGKLGLSMNEAKAYFLKKAEQCGLKPTKVKDYKKSALISFDTYGSMPFDKLQELAGVFAVPYDHDGDPPWDYELSHETAPAPGTFLTYQNQTWTLDNPLLLEINEDILTKKE